MSKEQEKQAVKVGGSPLKSVTVPQSPPDDDFITFGKSPLEPVKVEEIPIGTSTVAVGENPEEQEQELAETEEEIDSSEEEDQNQQETEEDEDINPYEFLGKQLQSDGFIDSDFEIKKGIQGRELYEAYSNKLKKEIEPQVTESVYRELAEQGVNEQDLIMAKLIRQGVDVTVLQNSVALYERLASYNKDAEESDKEIAIKHMYSTRGYGEEEADILISRAKEQDKLDDLYATSAKFFESKYKEFVTSQFEVAEAQKKQYRELVAKQDAHIKSKLSSGELYGDKIDKQIAKEIESAIYQNNEIVEVDGKKYNTSKFQKFMIDFNNDPELRVWAYKKYAYRDKELDAIKKETEKKLEEDFLGAYKKTVLKTTKNNTAKLVKDKLKEDAKKNGKSYIVEF